MESIINNLLKYLQEMKKNQNNNENFNTNNENFNANNENFNANNANMLEILNEKNDNKCKYFLIVINNNYPI